MKTLIFSVSAGGGHVHASKSIEQYINIYEPDSEIKIIDTLKSINPILDKLIIGSYLKTIKFSPSIFGKLYDFTESDEGFATTISTKFNELMAYKLLDMIEKFNPEIVIATHPFPVEMISYLKSKKYIDIPFVTIMTDYAPHSFWLHPNVDAYIVSNHDMVYEMNQRGIDENLVHDFGIPVKPDFIKQFDKNKTLLNMGLSPEKRTILIMGGSLGMGKIANVYKEIMESPLDIQIIVICGNNKKLFSELSELKDNYKKKSIIVGYTNEVNKYMQCCDLLLTKPGGITITEALISKIPIGIFSPIPGQEEKNADFLLKHNLAINLKDGLNCLENIEGILCRPSILNTMKKNCSKFAKPNSGHNIYLLLRSLINAKTKKIHL